METADSSKILVSTYKTTGLTSQNTTTWTLTALKTLNLISVYFLKF
jgi:hypothetical protein